MEHIGGQTQKIRAIPPQKRAEKIRDSAIGAGVIAIAFVLVKFFGHLPGVYFAFYLLLAFGFWSISRELTVGFLGYIPAAIREIRDAFGLGGKK